ncbi:MAG: hypothetical protein M1820_000858 [Bogoriella megaspora]|nr:MAG: hypothetical protein M1820_000858 [Bogoriella megaspora]
MSPPSSSGGSATNVIELQPVHHTLQSRNGPSSGSGTSKSKPLQSILGRIPRKNRTMTGDDAPGISLSHPEDRNEMLPSPSVAAEPTERWNHPTVNMYRTFATFWTFVMMGANDAAYGALIPYLESYYHLSYTVISLVFLTPFAGYTAAALLNNSIHMKFGQRGIAFLGPLAHLIAYIVIAVHPPYPVLIVVFAIAGFGNGVEDGAWNAWLGSMKNANEVLGFLHAFYGLGAVISPLAATTMVARDHFPWYSFYYLMIGGAVIELVTCVSTFWKADGAAFRVANPRTTENKGNRMREAVATRPAARVSWLCSIFLFIYVGIEVSLGGWVVVFMTNVRHGAPFSAGMVETGFWLGITVGRIVLGFVTPRIGEKLAIAIYLPIAIGFQLLFWLVPQFYVSAVAVSLQGFFLGPLFPASVIAATKLLPKHLHVSAIGFSAAFGGGGAAIFPFIVGAIAQSKGVQVLQPIVLAMLAADLVCWLMLPRMEKKRD